MFIYLSKNYKTKINNYKTKKHYENIFIKAKVPSLRNSIYCCIFFN